MLIVFAYHNFCDKYNGRSTHLYVDLENLSKQLDFFKKRFSNFIFLSDYLARYEQLKNELFIAITVDDGIDNFKLAYNYFKGKNLKVNLFISSNKIGIKEYSKDLNRTVKYLTKEELSGFDSDIVNIQNHGASHRDINSILVDEYKMEILNSKKYMEHVFNKKIDVFCYPYGSHNQQAIDFLKSSGYIGACTTISGTNKTLDFFKIKRIPVATYDSGGDLEVKVSTYENTK